MKGNEFVLSIIIPVYNCEKYIRKCLDSVCSQKIGEMQVICINDCSQDNSLSILEEYAQRYDFIEVYSNEHNSGLATTRNRGIGYARGKYLMFLDADDYIKENTLNTIVTLADNRKVDVLLYDMLMFSDNKDDIDFDSQWRVRKHVYEQNKGIEMLCALIANKEMSGTACGSIYKTKFISDNNITFIDNILHEDIPFSFHTMLYAREIHYLHKIVYCYRQRSDSILHAPNYKKLLEGLAVGHAYMNRLWNQYKKTESWNAIQETFIQQYFESLIEMMEQRYISILESKDYEIDEALLNIINKYHLFEKINIEKYIDKQDIFDLKHIKNIVIYGAGYYAKKIYILLRKNNIDVESFYVTDTKNNPCEIFGLPVREYLKEEKQQCIIIAVSKKMQNEILNRIDRNNNRIIQIKL